MKKKALLDTNIIIHREASYPISQSVGTLYRWLDRGGYQKIVHNLTISEIIKNCNQNTVNAFKKKLNSYEVIEISSPMHAKVRDMGGEYDSNNNDNVDTALLNEVYVGRVDILITEDKKIHKKAATLGISDKVYTIDSFLEKIYSDNPELADYKVLNVQKKQFGCIGLSDPFFNSLKEDYDGFEKWFLRKYDEKAYITINSENNRLLSFLYLKVEDEDEDYFSISPPFPKKRRLKVGTFKVISNGFRLGERFLKIIFDNALKMHVHEIYVTIYNKRIEQQRLIDLLQEWGFYFWGTKGEELVYVRDFAPNYNKEKLKHCFPYVSRRSRSYLVAIHPDYHTELLPDSILNTESPGDYIENFPHRNCINKVYVSHAFGPYPQAGDIIIFYRTGGYHKSVISTLGVVVETNSSLNSEEEFISYCRKKSVFSENELREKWNCGRSKPIVISFLCVYTFPHRINMAKLIDLGILKGINDAPRGFKLISSEQLNLILRETKSDESFIVD